MIDWKSKLINKPSVRYSAISLSFIFYLLIASTCGLPADQTSLNTPVANISAISFTGTISSGDDPKNVSGGVYGLCLYYKIYPDTGFNAQAAYNNDFSIWNSATSAYIGNPQGAAAASNYLPLDKNLPTSSLVTNPPIPTFTITSLSNWSLNVDFSFKNITGTFYAYINGVQYSRQAYSISQENRKFFDYGDISTGDIDYPTNISGTPSGFSIGIIGFVYSNNPDSAAGTLSINYSSPIQIGAYPYNVNTAYDKAN